MCPCHANSECLDMPHQKSAVCGQHHNIFSARVKTYLVHRTRVTMPSPQPWIAALSEKKIVVRNLLLPRVTFLKPLFDHTSLLLRIFPNTSQEGAMEGNVSQTEDMRMR